MRKLNIFFQNLFSICVSVFLAVFLTGFFVITSMQIFADGEWKLRYLNSFFSENYFKFILIAIIISSPASLIYFLIYSFYLRPQKATFNMFLIFAFIVALPFGLFSAIIVHPIFLLCFLSAALLVTIFSYFSQKYWNRIYD